MTGQRKVHFIGIGGAGLSAIARLLLESGYQVSGSDRQLSPLAQSLQEAGVKVFLGHNAGNISGADLVIRSSAISDENVEVQAAHQANIPVFKRADFLGHLMAEHLGIAIAGTHGKTTTTAMIAWMLTSLGQDPSYIIGGVSHNLSNNAHAGKGEAFVIEADEYDRMFLGLKPYVAIVTNIEHDHPDCYPTPADFYTAFMSFVSGVVSGGWLIACADDPGARRLMEDTRHLPLKVVSYALSEPWANWRAGHLEAIPGVGYRFCALQLPGKATTSQIEQLFVTLQVPGLHNVRNALAALAVAHCLDLPLLPACQALSAFQGTGRRFEVRGEVAGVTVIDDYAHHPTEIRATLAAARQRYPGRRIWAVWQPHTFSRTRALFDAFAAAFQDADEVIVTEIFASREGDQVGRFSSQDVVKAMQHSRAYFLAELKQVVEFLVGELVPGDVLIVMSAGDADQVSDQVLARLEDKEK